MVNSQSANKSSTVGYHFQILPDPFLPAHNNRFFTFHMQLACRFVYINFRLYIQGSGWGAGKGGEALLSSAQMSC